jgi:hypothetical protein
MGLKSPNFDRDVKIFKDVITLGTYTAVAKKYTLHRSRISRIFDRHLRNIHHFINSQKYPRPTGWTKAEMVEDKAYWLELADKHAKWINDRANITVDSPLDHLLLTPSLCGMLFNLNIMTVGDLLEQLKTDKRRLLDSVGFGVATLRHLESKLKHHNFDIQLGRTQQPSRKKDDEPQFNKHPNCYSAPFHQR